MWYLTCKGQRICPAGNLPAFHLNRFVREFPQFRIEWIPT